MNDKKPSAREACLKSLVDFEKAGKYSNIELSEALRRYGFEERDRGFFTKLFYGVIEKKLTLDYLVKSICDKDKKIAPEILNILRMGLYQLLYMDKIPESAACDESVKLAKSFNPQNTKVGGFVNAVLRAFIRDKGQLLENIDKIKDSCKYFEIKYSCSRDIIKIWTDSYGTETAEELLRASQNNRGLTICVNGLKISRDAYFEKLSSLKERLTAEKTEISPYGIIIEGDIAVTDIYGHGEGLFFVQDEASQICALKTRAKPSDLVVDCCAAPGGKSFCMAQMMENKGRIVCFDLHENRLDLITKSSKRLGIGIIETHKRDMAAPFGNSDELKEKADVVLCDAPCSGLGVINKKPEIKYKTLGEISRMQKIQAKLLSNCSACVKPGGVLVYSTCTLNKKENEEVAREFAGAHKDFEIRSLETFFPFRQKTDGFFIAEMRRVGP
ncbi:MAG: 16S rRNA (cytosine(967)-C(5))-methyltransferase RsmB [Oscillospiraceae bacterium]|nr:16S rRNA (cytosine(967)-C(5))-methyltransferase RsmB [Oscillospiraceae bacterium]